MEPVKTREAPPDDIADCSKSVDCGAFSSSSPYIYRRNATAPLQPHISSTTRMMSVTPAALIKI